jgi:hypothetical protein
MRHLKCLVCFLVTALAATTAGAHDPGLSRGELRRSGDNLQLRLAFHASDIALALELPADNSLSTAAVRRAWQEQLATRIQLLCIDPPSAPAAVRVGVPQSDQGKGLVVTILASAAGCRRFEIREQLLGRLLPGHRQILLVFNATGAQTDTRVLTASATTLHLDLTSASAISEPGRAGWLVGWRGMIGEGVHHILIGYDHLAFLLVLLLAVLIQAQERGQPDTTTARRLLVVITAFTVAHSVTLGLSATGMLRLPGAPVEAVIALSIVIAGLLNLTRERRIEGAWLAFGFGLVHGFGFAGAFAELAPVDGPVGWLTVAQFNLGVELGQLLVGLPACALGLYVMKHMAAGPRLARHGSAMAAGLGTLWFLQRTIL